MGAGWIAQGADTPAPAAGATDAQPGATTAPADPWKPTAPDSSSVPALVRPHQAADPIEGSQSLFKRVTGAIAGTAEDPSTPLGAVVDWGKNRALAPGPSTATLASAYPHLIGAQFEKGKAGYEESTGAKQTQAAERQLAAINVLPQVAARYTQPGSLPDYDKMAEDPLVKKTAISIGVSPAVFVRDYDAISASSKESVADTAARAKQTLEEGRQNVVAGRQDRAQAWADERVWQPSDLENGKLDPMSLKGLAFNTALAIPGLAAVTGAAAAGSAVGGPAGGIAAGAATATALFAPGQRADIKDKIDDQVATLLQKADALDDAAPIGGKRGLNPVTEQIRQQAADLNANSDKIADTAGLLYAVSDVAGAIPVSAVLSKSPAGKAVLDRIVGSAMQKTVGGRIAGSMVANGAGGMLQASIQKAVDTGVIHEQTTLSDALKDIAYTGVTSALTAAPIAAAHEAIGAPGRAQAKRDLDSDELLARVKAAAAQPMGGAAEEELYPGYKWNDATGRYESTGTRGPSNAPRLGGPPEATAPGAAGTAGPGGPAGGGAGGGAGAAPQSEAPTGAAGARAAYKAKTDALNAAAAAAEKRSDVSLQPEENGWSVHVKGEPVATFETAEAAREAMAQARKVVGTKPTAAATNAAPSETETPNAATNAPSAETTSGSAPSPAGGETGTARIPEDELERTQPVQPERRSQGEMRQRVDQMTPEQMKAALLTHELTGIPNRRAYEDSPKKAAQVSVDVDSLKWLNDNAGHESGDQLLKAVAQAMHEETGGNAYHISGDEFTAQADSHEEAESAMARVRSRLAEAKLTFAHPDGRTITLSGIGVSHGTGSTLETAERNLGQAKAGREQRGLRAARGEQPPNARIESHQPGLQTGGGAAAAQGTEVLGQRVKPPQKPTVGQSAAGNYFKPSVQWNGLPIKVENVKGQRRRYLDAKTGKPGQRVMKADYGYFPGTKGNDEDGIDVMMGPHHDAPNAYVIDQLDHTGKKFDEHKVQLGVRNEAEARAQYLSHYPEGWKGLGAITELDHAQLKRWLKEGDLTKPISPDAVPVAKVVRGAAPNNRHDSILQYLARHSRGIDSEEAEAQGIDRADMALPAAHVGIKRAFRKGGMTFDEAAEHLHESGYRVANRQGHYDPNVLLDKISDELRGRPHFSVHNETETEKEHLPDWRTPLTDEQLRKLSVDEAQTRLEQLRQEQERLEREIERAGLANDEPAHEDDLEDSIVFQRKGPPGVREQQDLFGDKVSVQNQIKKLEAELDRKRNSGQESLETGRPDDLFSQSRRQLDLATAADEAWSPLEPAELLARSIPEVREYIAAAKAGGHAAEAKEGERVLAIHQEQARAEREFAEQRPITPYGEMLLEDLEKKGKTTYEVRETSRSRGKGKVVSAASAPDQLDIFANAAAPAPATSAAQLVQSVKLAHVGEFRSGIDKVKSWQDAAHIMAPLRKQAQENMTALVLDRAGKPLAVIRHSIGSSNAANVETWSLTGAIAQVPGAAQVYFAHNHPSGEVDQSSADEAITVRLHKLLTGTGIEPKGMIVVGPNNRQASYYAPQRNRNSLIQREPIPAAVRRGSVPSLERRYGRLPVGGPSGRFKVSSPSAGREMVEQLIKDGTASGVMLLDHRHHRVGIVPMAPDEMAKLRSGNPSTGAARLLNAAAEANANTMIVWGPNKEAANNVAVFGNVAGIRPVDVFTSNEDGRVEGAAIKGEVPTRENFLQRPFVPPAGWEQATKPRARGMAPAEVQASVDQFLAGFKVKPKIVIAKNLAALQNGPDADLAFHLAGYEPGDVTAFLKPSTGEIHLIADQFHSPADVAATLAHEYVGHFGLRELYGEKGYQAILDGVNEAMPSDVRMRGQREYGDAYNHFNPGHRARAAEETLAYYSQRYTNDQSIPAQMKRWVEKWLGKIRDWIRNVLKLPQKFDELFVKRTLADLENHLRRGSTSRASDRRRTEAEPAFAGPQDTFFSGLAKAVDAAKREKGTGAEWEATLRNMPGVKAEEMQWTGLKDWLEGRGRVSKQEVAEYVAAHRLQLGEAVHGGAGQRPLTEDELMEIDERLADAGISETEGDQREALMKGGPDTEHMLDELKRMGIKVGEFRDRGTSRNEALIDRIRNLGYTVEEGVHGDPVLEEIPSDEHESDLSEPVQDVTHQANYDQAKALLEQLDSGDMTPPKYAEHSTPGGENYRELLMTMPHSGDLKQLTSAKEDAMELRVRASEKVSDATRAFLAHVTTPNQQVMRANIGHWLYDATNEATDKDDVMLRYEADRKLTAAIRRLPIEKQDAARAAREEGIRTNAALRQALNVEHKAIIAAKHAEGYVSPHWGERNVLAHIRFDDRTGPNGEKILHINEVQSDWHQTGRKAGYLQKGAMAHADKLRGARLRASSAVAANEDLGFDSTTQALNAIVSHEDWKDRWGDMDAGSIQAIEEYRRLRLLSDAQTTNPAGWAVVNQGPEAVPDAPFKTSWPELAMKRMLRYAVEHGYDKLSWDTGSTNADRYSLQAVVDAISVQADGPGEYKMFAYKDNKTIKDARSLTPERLRDLIGKDMAQKAVTDLNGGKVVAAFEGDDLKVGGAGMRGFYDDILPKAVNKMVKKWGSSVEPGTVTGLRDSGEIDPQTMSDKGVSTTFPAHMVDITPAMRDSVMGGQPMFLKRRKGSTGSAPAAPKRGAYDLARRAVAAIPNNEFAMSLRRIVDPAGVSDPARATAVVTREALGELARNSEEALQNLERYAKQFDLLGTQDRYDFIDSMETGSKQKNTELQPAADALRAILDDWRERIRGLGVGALDSFIENYFPHIWADDAKAKKVFGQIFGRRPMKGPASFLKERTIPTTREGLEAGLTPISTNPLVLAFAKLREMQRFYTGVKLMQRFKDEGLAKFLPANKMRPDDWAEINDAVGRVRQWSETEQGFIERGKYIMPVDAARVINNHLGASALRNFLPAQIFRVLSNAANALQLGFSGFHLGFTTFDVIISKNALGIEQLLHGQAVKAARTLLEANAGLAAAAVAGPIPGVIGALTTAGLNIRRGHQLLKAYANIGGATPQMRRIVEGLEAAGGRVKMDNYYMAARGLSPFKGVGLATLAGDVRAALTQPRGKVQALTQTLTSFPQQYAMRLWRDLEQVWELEPLKIFPIMSALEVTGRMVRASTSVIMEHIVPLQKLGVFSDLASDHIQRNPLEDPVAFAASMQKIWNSVDNRLGEMVYDNLFWDRTFKEVNHMMVRAVGWNLGTVRELGGAPIDVIKLLDYMARAHRPSSRRRPWARPRRRGLTMRRRSRSSSASPRRSGTRSPTPWRWWA